jgi:hypothetical protein
MRVSNDRYSHELRAFALARRMLGHEARPNTVSLWTKLSTERVENISVIHRREGHHRAPSRHGPSRSKLSGVLTSPSLRSEAAAVAGVCRFLKLIPDTPLANASSALPNVERGEGLCSAYELFRRLMPYARLSLEELGLLVVSLAEGAEWGLERCACGTLMIIDRLEPERRMCEDCQHEARGRGGRAARISKERDSGPTRSRPVWSVEHEQLELFSDLADTEDSD